MKILDNINHTVREDLQDTMQKGSRVSIAAACFSIYAYQELKKQLEEIAELRFIFTSPISGRCLQYHSRSAVSSFFEYLYHYITQL